MGFLGKAIEGGAKTPNRAPAPAHAPINFEQKHEQGQD